MHSSEKEGAYKSSNISLESRAMLRTALVTFNRRTHRHEMPRNARSKNRDEFCGLSCVPPNLDGIQQMLAETNHLLLHAHEQEPARTTYIRGLFWTLDKLVEHSN